MDETNKPEAKRQPKQARTRNPAKRAKAPDEAQKQIDPERLFKAIQYLKNSRER